MDYRDEEAFVRTSFYDERDAGNMSPRGPRSRSSTPPFDTKSATSSSPKTIILALRPHARGDQIEYYVQGYQSLYPTAEILLLQYSRTSTKHIEGVLSSLIDDREKQSFQHAQEPGVLIHLFGDNAATQICRLLRSHRLRAARTLDVKSIILDSVPVAVAPHHQTIRHLPTRLLISVWLYIVSIFWRLASVMTIWCPEPYSTQVTQDLHDSTLLPATARKCYIFPENDLMFAWDSPTEDDEFSQRHEFRVRRNSIDHKQHWTSNQERYWLGIENAWDGR